MAAPRPARPKPLEWNGPSYQAIFIRNLKLLHLDQREDWPDITLRSLSSSSANQRQRIRLVEWALYYLFNIWDPESALNKLRPFFPPLEPLQSVNLRAALFRALTELKKNGDLGRETILRKTMLDDCKGEKFDELLAVFSTAVLRKLLAVSASDAQWSTAMKLSTATSISTIDYQNMIPLVIAHQVSLSATGERRARVHDAYDQFSRLLDDKKAELAERAKKGLVEDVSQAQVGSEAMERELRANWLGSEEWASALLDGGAQSATDSFLELPFSKAWKTATESSVNSLSGSAKQDLVVDLETRVRRLRSRLRRWHEFNDSLRKERGASGTINGAGSQGTCLLFRDHQPLTVASISKAVRQPADRGRALKDDDKSFILTVNEAISRINGKPRGNRGRSSPNNFDSPSPVNYNTHTSKSLESPVVEAAAAPSTYPEPLNQTPELEKSQAQTPTVRLSPEPEDTYDPEPNFEPVKQRSSSYYTLAERTRKSMSLIPPLPSHEAPTHPRQRRGPRVSFPVNQFQTPRKSSGNGRSGASTPQDKLFEEDAEYNSVFKSRPRIACSPISSPAVHVSPSFDEDEGFDLDNDGTEWADVDSPSVASRYR
ncbi:hypothetical protein N7478_008395 [Penicillium angulare]|uniref:uncharacterized protein n=1 Tax=Penicillium angulare TaxID=116970 RepID=UPI00253F7137|nr:uncharacterized protein N7478_008395 [Penicillium angulare]KAJ5273270.1 hypothetical protein N7478_008395 [Penicillium angulare]